MFQVFSQVVNRVQLSKIALEESSFDLLAPFSKKCFCLFEHASYSQARLVMQARSVKCSMRE